MEQCVLQKLWSTNNQIIEPQSTSSYLDVPRPSYVTNTVAVFIARTLSKYRTTEDMHSGNSAKSYMGQKT